MEQLITKQAVERSQSEAILYQKDPPQAKMALEAGPSCRERIVFERVQALLHPDFRIARRWLAEPRFLALSGAASVTVKRDGDEV